MSVGIKIYEAMFDEVQLLMETENFCNHDRIREAIALLDEFNRFIELEMRRTKIPKDIYTNYISANNKMALVLDGKTRPKSA